MTNIQNFPRYQFYAENKQHLKRSLVVCQAKKDHYDDSTENQEFEIKHFEEVTEKSAEEIEELQTNSD